MSGGILQEWQFLVGCWWYAHGFLKRLGSEQRAVQCPGGQAAAGSQGNCSAPSAQQSALCCTAEPVLFITGFTITSLCLTRCFGLLDTTSYQFYWGELNSYYLKAEKSFVSVFSYLPLSNSFLFYLIRNQRYSDTPMGNYKSYANIANVSINIHFILNLFDQIHTLSDSISANISLNSDYQACLLKQHILSNYSQQTCNC